MEAWETAEWQEREAYIESVQEHQVQELQHAIMRAQQDVCALDTWFTDSLYMMHCTDQAYGVDLLTSWCC